MNTDVAVPDANLTAKSGKTAPPTEGLDERSRKYRQLRRQRGHRKEVAALLEVSCSTLARREGGKMHIPEEAMLALQSLPTRQGGPFQ